MYESVWQKLGHTRGGQKKRHFKLIWKQNLCQLMHIYKLRNNYVKCTSFIDFFFYTTFAVHLLIFNFDCCFFVSGHEKNLAFVIYYSWEHILCFVLFGGCRNALKVFQIIAAGKWTFSNFFCLFLNSNIFSNLNSNCYI